MNHKDKINEIIEVSKKRLELKKIGLLPYAIGPTGPTGPSGRGLEIMGSYASLEELKKDCSKKQKKGIHFIIASIIIWSMVLIVQITNLPILTKNLLTFCCTAPLLPISFLISKILKIQFQDKSNPLNKLGILFSVNQMIYLLIAMWIYPTMPDKMLMVIAMIFGAHLLPYSWLYNSKTYMVLSIIIPILSLIVGLNFANYILATMMIVIEIIFSILLAFENKKIKND